MGLTNVKKTTLIKALAFLSSSNQNFSFQNTNPIMGYYYFVLMRKWKRNSTIHANKSYTPTPWLTRIRFMQISLTRLFKKNSDICILNADSFTYIHNVHTYLLLIHNTRNSSKVKI